MPCPRRPSGPTGRRSFHDVPTAAQLLEAVREWLESDVRDATEGRVQFHTRVAANVLSTVERELALGPAMAVAHATRLAALGVSSDRDLADRIRAASGPPTTAPCSTASARPSSTSSR